MTGELGASVSGSLNHTAPTTNKKESPPHQKSYACDRIVIHVSTNRQHVRAFQSDPVKDETALKA